MGTRRARAHDTLIASGSLDCIHRVHQRVCQIKRAAKMMIKASGSSCRRRCCGAAAMPPLLLAAALAAVAASSGRLGAAAANTVASSAAAGAAELRAPAANQRRPIFFSESKLRAVIEATNGELRQLKRDFMKQMTDVYLRLKLDPELGYEVARDQTTAAASANLLVAQEFASMALRRHVIQRRLLTGLKLAFTKFLPMQTLVNLFRRYKSFEWLKDQEQVELRPKFPSARENQFVILYTLIELRARARAAEDVLALTADSMRRVLQTVQWFLVESAHGPEVSGAELAGLAANSKVVMQYYEREVLEWRQKLRAAYASFMENAKPLAELAGGAAALTRFLDRLIDVEALDIDLNAQAAALEFPPTINAQMIANVQKRWIPWYVLKSLGEDRRVLLANRKRVMHLVRLDEGAQAGRELEEWLGQMLDYVCHNDVAYYGRRR